MTLTLTTILITIGASVVLAISNIIAYERGSHHGYDVGFQEGIHTEIRKTGDKAYSVTITYKE